jgi:hypothetical protein
VTFQRLGKTSKPVQDYRHRTVSVYRYRCCDCRRIFRHYPEGVDRANQTQRLRKLAAIYWVLGLSLCKVGLDLSPFKVQINHMSVWWDLQEQVSLLAKRHYWQVARVLGLDGAYPLLASKK